MIPAHTQDSLIGRQRAQRCQNQGCWLILTETPVLKDEICCWMKTMNPSDRHLSMATIVRLGTSARCMAMAPPERRECVPMSSRAKPSLAAPTRRHSALVTAMMLDVLTERRP